MGSLLKSIGGSLELFLQPLSRIHLYSDLGGEIAPQSDIAYVYLFTGIALFVLVIACINFINLATARSAVRAREIGMRKTLGAPRYKLISQFTGEAVIYSLFTVILAGILVFLSLPLFRSVIGRELGLHISNPFWLVLGMVGLALFVGIFAGSYPAFYLSAIQPLRVLKGRLTSGLSRSRLRNGLVVFQFAISIVLIIGTISISNQIRFMKHKELGFKKEQVVIISGVRQSVGKHNFSALRHELMEISGIINVGGASLVPSRGTQKAIMFPEGFAENQPQMGEKLFTDAQYLSTMGVKLIAGRYFSEKLSSDPMEAVIINETAAKKFGWTDAIGKTFTVKFSKEQNKLMKVVGVVQDFHSASLHRHIEPLIIFNDVLRIQFLAVKILPKTLTQTMGLLKQKWQELVPNRPFDYFFLDTSLEAMYRAEEQLEHISLAFCLIATFVGGLGLFGLAAFIAEQRIKEIGIRKVFGASIPSIVQLLSHEFIILIVISNIIAWPAAYLGLDQWLQNFAYKAGIGWWTFLIAGALALVIALLTVSYQAIRAAMANPVTALKYE